MITTKKTPSIVIYFSEYENIASLKKIPDVLLGQYDVRSLVLREKDYWAIMKFRNILKMIFSGIQERKRGLHIGTYNVLIYLLTYGQQNTT
jgi:hypothetical protein